MQTLVMDLPNGQLTLYVLEDEPRAVCVHVRDGEPAVQPTGTITNRRTGEVVSWELCRICSAFHTVSDEQRGEQAYRNVMGEALEVRIREQEDEPPR